MVLDGAEVIMDPSEDLEVSLDAEDIDVGLGAEGVALDPGCLGVASADEVGCEADLGPGDEVGAARVKGSVFKGMLEM